MPEEWIEKYSELMFGISHTEDSMRDAADLKYFHMPSKLYKYRVMNEKSIEALEKGVLFASSCTSFNDYRELNIVFTDSAMAKACQKVYNSLKSEYGLPDAVINNFEDILFYSDKAFKEQASGLYAKRDFFKSPIYDVIKDYSTKRIEEAKVKARNECHKVYNICCFSSRKDIDPMWGLYSDRSKGFCIEYDFKNLGVQNEDVQLMLPVLYKDDNRMLIDDIDNISGSLSMYAFCLKTQDWSFEREWRRFYSYSPQSVPQKMPCPTAVYLGVNAEDGPEKTRIINFCENKIPVFQMKYNIYGNKLEPFLL